MMCSNAGDCSCSTELTRITIQQHRRQQCVKCKGSNGPPALIVRNDDPALCRVCFINGCLHKFKSSFGKTNVIRNDSKVAIAVSGGLSSVTLVQLLRQHSKRRFTPTLFHLIEPHSCPADHDAVAATVQESGFEYHLLDPIQVHPALASLREAIHSLLPLSEVKHIPDLDKWIRQRLLVNCAKQLGCGYLCLGDSGTRLATNFFVGVIEGRSGQVGGGTLFMDKRYEEVIIIRPLYEFQTKELAFYAQFCQLKPLTPHDLVTNAALERPGVTSLPRLCEDFLLSLQFGGFPSTTQTVLSTCSKIASPESIDPASQRCCLCWGTVVPSVRLDNPHKLALAALEYSQLVSGSKSTQTRPTSTESNLLDTTRSAANIGSHLCPSCSMVYSELPKDLQVLFDTAFSSEANENAL